MAALETHAAPVRENGRPLVTVYLPRKDGDTRPLGHYTLPGGARVFLYLAGDQKTEGQ